MADFDSSVALSLMKARLNRLAADTSLDVLFTNIIAAEAARLTGTGITLDDSPEMTNLVVSYAVDTYQARDRQTGTPEWLRLQRREAWLQQMLKGEET